MYYIYIYIYIYIHTYMSIKCNTVPTPVTLHAFPYDWTDEAGRLAGRPT